MSAPLPPCGCQRGCQHREHPRFPPQRECRIGYVPPAHAIRGRTIPCPDTTPHGLHPILDGPFTGAMCPGLELAAPSPAEALEEFVRVWTAGMTALADSVRQVAEAAIPAMADLRRAVEALAAAGLVDKSNDTDDQEEDHSGQQ